MTGTSHGGRGRRRLRRRGRTRLGIATAEVHADLAAAFGTDELSAEARRRAGRADVRKLDLADRARCPSWPSTPTCSRDAYSERAPRCADPVHGAAGARRLPPRPGAAHRDRLGGARLRGRAGHPAGGAPRPRRPRCATSPGCSAPSTTRPATCSSATPTQAASARSGRRLGAPQQRAPSAPGTPKRGGLDPGDQDVLLRALQAGQGRLRSVYEARHRPSWLPIPLELPRRVLAWHDDRE